MYLQELAETRVLVIFCGRFQPFHQGHAKVYKDLVSEFGRNNVYIATSGKVEFPDSPFDLGERIFFMNLQGVPSDRIIQVTQNYNIEAVKQAFQIQDLSQYKILFAVSDKDIEEKPNLFSGAPKKDGTPAKLQPLPADLSSVQTADKFAYIKRVNVVPFRVQGQVCKGASDIRKQYIPADAEKRQNIIVDVFGRYSREAQVIFDNKLGVDTPAKPEPLARQAKLQPVKKPEPMQEAQTDYQKRRQRERDVDAGRPVAKQRQPRQTDYQKRREQERRELEMGESLSDKNLDQLMALKQQLSPENNLRLLQQQRDRLKKLETVKQQIERLQSELTTRMGGELPAGMAADLEDYYTMDDVENHFPEMLAAYEKQLNLLLAYKARRRGLFKSPTGLRTGVRQPAEEAAQPISKAQQDYYRFLAYKFNRNPGLLTKEEREELRQYFELRKTSQPVTEKWSEKYKRSINCSNPKGFSQRAHCQGRKKNESWDTQQFKSAADQDRIPTKFVTQGFTVQFDPNSSQVFISKGNKLIYQYQFKGVPTYSNYIKYVNRAIEELEKKMFEVTGDAKFDSMMNKIVTTDPYVRQAVYTEASILCDFYHCKIDQLTPQMINRVAKNVGVDADTVAFLLSIKNQNNVTEEPGQ